VIAFQIAGRLGTRKGRSQRIHELELATLLSLLSVSSTLVTASAFENLSLRQTHAASSVVLPEGCHADAYPITIQQDGKTYVACSIYSPEQRLTKAQLEKQAAASLTSENLMPTPILWVAYEPRNSTYDLALSRNLTPAENSKIQSLVPGKFNAEILKIQLTASVCDTWTAPPTGVCDTVHNGGGSLGWRAKQLVCPFGCFFIYGGTTYSHGSVAKGDTVFQPDASRSYGTVGGAVCSNGVDASWFYLNSGQSQMNNSMFQGGPAFGDWTGGFVSGLLLKQIGRGSVNLGTYTLYSAESASTCGTSGTDWFAKWYSGSQSAGGDSGSGVGVGATQGGSNGALRCGIEWGITTRDGVLTIIMSQWSNVQSALGIQSY